MSSDAGLERVLTRISARYRDEPLLLLQMLRAVQASYSCVPHEAIRFFASHLKLPLSQVLGVVEFYSFLHRSPRGRYDLYFSDNITDRMLGSQALAAQLCARLGVVPGVPREDGQVTVAFTSCTGMCDQGPAALVNGLALTRLDPARIDELAELVEAGIALEAWPREWFAVHDNIRRPGAIFTTAFAEGEALAAARARGPDAVLSELELSGLRGRGGAGFLTAQKWRFCRESEGDARFIVCNADEGEPGTFKDRVLLTRLPDALFEGMTIAGLAVGAHRGLLYLRAEYEYLRPLLEAVLVRRRDAGLLGPDALGSGEGFDIAIHMGAGAYICGEESALIESLEGKRGQARVRPPFPVKRGYVQKPTVVNNVQTFIQAAQIALKGGAWFAAQGTEMSPGSVVLSVSGDVARRGIHEYPFGVTLGEVLADCGAYAVKAVQVGGPSGHLVGPADFGRRIAFEDLVTTGSLMVFDTSRDILAVVQNFIHFFEHESCGFCTPCRVGTTMLRRLVDRVVAGQASEADLAEIVATSLVTRSVSHCGLGQSAPLSLLDALQRFRADFSAKLSGRGRDPGFDLDGALAQARALREVEHG
jgi:[NiFe] hydrogenase diaphorase moiety large subunit